MEVDSMDIILSRREVTNDRKRPLSPRGRAVVIQHLVRLRDRCGEQFLKSFDCTRAAVRGNPTTQMKDLYKVVALLDSMTDDEAIALLGADFDRRWMLDRFRDAIKDLKTPTIRPPSVGAVNWEAFFSAVDTQKDEMSKNAIRVQSKLNRGVHVPSNLITLLQEWLILALYAYHPPRRNEFHSILLRNYDENTDNFYQRGVIVLNHYSTHYYRGRYELAVAPKVRSIIDAVARYRLANAKDGESVYLFNRSTCPDSRVDCDNFSAAFSTACRRLLHTPLTIRQLGHMYVEHHVRKGLPVSRGLWDAMGRDLSQLLKRNQD